MVRKEIQGNAYAIHGSMVLDTVPAAFADEWLADTSKADTLILCGTNPFPKTVERFLTERPNGKVYAPHYTAYLLEGILGGEFSKRCELVRDTKTLGDITLSVTSQAGKGSYLSASCNNEVIWSGKVVSPFPEAVVYDEPTVVLCYTSGCDFTETVAEKIAEGIRDTEGVATRLIDLAAAPAAEVVSKLVFAAGILIGTPTVDGDAAKSVWDLLTAMSKELFQGKFSSAFGAYTSDGSGEKHIIERMQQLGMNVIDGGYTVQYRPDETALNSTYEYGYYFGCKLQNKPNTHQSRLVKCLVCGEIFDSSLGVCPVCGVGLDKCVPVEDEVITFKADTDRTYLIAGGGAAALAAADAIRNRDQTGRIVMICAEEFLPINRPMLSKNMAVAARVEHSIDVKTTEWFTERKIELRLNTSVTSFDSQKKTAALSDGSEISYDKYICATGAECIVPPIAGKELDGVITVRHLRDVHNIWARLEKAKNAVVIGGGVLGLEIAAELKKMRMNVTVLGKNPKIMPRQLDDETGTALVQAAVEYGIPIHTGVNITGILGNEHVSAVQLEDGTEFSADLVVMSCGNRANTDEAKAAGVNCGRAIIVTERMETNLPDVFAAGDCAELNGVNFQLWAEASEQGRVAGANAAGDRIKYQAVPYGVSFEGMNTRLFAIGDVGKGKKDYRVVEYHDEIEKSFRKYWFLDNRLVGGILFGNTDRVPMLTDALTAKKSYYALREEL